MFGGALWVHHDLSNGGAEDALPEWIREAGT